MLRNMRQLMSRTRNRKKSKVNNKNHSSKNSLMSPMLEFLSMPGNYFSNLQSSYASSSASGSNDGSNNILGGVTGLLANNPLTTGLNGLIGDGSLSRKVAWTHHNYRDKTLTLCPCLAGLYHRAHHLVQTRHLVSRLHRCPHRLGPALCRDGRPGRRLRAPLQRHQRQGVLGLRVRVWWSVRTQWWYWKYRLHQQTGPHSSILPVL